MEPKEKLLRIVRNAQGDDLERATAAFAGHSNEAMQKKYGSSGKTCRQILDGYKKERSDYDNMMRWLLRLF